VAKVGTSNSDCTISLRLQCVVKKHKKHTFETLQSNLCSAVSTVVTQFCSMKINKAHKGDTVITSCNSLLHIMKMV